MTFTDDHTIERTVVHKRPIKMYHKVMQLTTRRLQEIIEREAAILRCQKAIEILSQGLVYHEHDGHDMPKKVARDALEALGVPRELQP